MPNFTIRKKIQ